MYRAGMRIERVEEPLWDRVERFPQAQHFEAGTFWPGLRCPDLQPARAAVRQEALYKHPRADGLRDLSARFVWNRSLKKLHIVCLLHESLWKRSL